MGRHLTRWLIPLPAILFAFWPTVIRAQAQPGLVTTYFTIDEIPPLQSTSEYSICGSEIENNINRSYDGEPFEDCTYDYFMVHMVGRISIPQHDTIEFMIGSDDGGEITIDDNTFGVWYDQGCTWTMSGPLDIQPGNRDLELWMYENGGGTCIMLAWKIDDGDWEIVPDEAFTTQSAVTSTTSTSTTTTTPATSTTVEETTTSSSTSTTTLPTSTTTIQEETTTSTTSTTSSTTTTVAPAPTTTQAPYTPPQTTTSTSSTSLPPEPTTTTTSLPEPSTTVEETSTTVPDSTIPDVTVPDSTTPQTTAPTLPDETTPPTSQPSPETSIQKTEPEEVESSSTTTILEIKADESISDEKVEQILETLTDAKPEQIVAAIEQVLTSNLTTDQAVSIASSPEVLAAITQEQAEQIFEEIIVEELSVEQADELVAVLNEAPTKVKKAFQETINVFTGLFDNFQMVGQTIPVGERRTLVAVSNTLVAVGASLRRREN